MNSCFVQTVPIFEFDYFFHTVKFIFIHKYKKLANKQQILIWLSTLDLQRLGQIIKDNKKLEITEIGRNFIKDVFKLKFVIFKVSETSKVYSLCTRKLIHIITKNSFHTDAWDF